MSKIDFLLIYESKIRELDSIVLLANEHRRRGYTVDIASFQDVYIAKRVPRFRNQVRVVVMPSLYHDEKVYGLACSIAGKASLCGIGFQ